MFPTLVAVVVMLTFSAPFTSLAQQVPMQTQTESAAARNTNTMLRLEIKATAARDANSDIVKLSDVVLFDPHDPVMRCGCTSVGAMVGAGLGCLVGHLIGRIDSSGDSRDWMIIGTLVGTLVGGVVLDNWIFNNQTGPLPKRFLGKSPEYIQSYTDAYRAKMRALQTK